MSAILPHPRPAMDQTLVIGLDGVDLSDLTPAEHAAVLAAANAAATDAVLRIWERNAEAAGEHDAAERARAMLPGGQFPAPAPARPLDADLRRHHRWSVSLGLLAGAFWVGAAVAAITAVCS